jgi:hypothetical protein
VKLANKRRGAPMVTAHRLMASLTELEFAIFNASRFATDRLFWLIEAHRCADEYRIGRHTTTESTEAALAWAKSAHRAYLNERAHIRRLRLRQHDRLRKLRAAQTVRLELVP